MPGEDMPDVRPGQPSVELQRMDAGDAEDDIDPIAGEQIDDSYAAASFSRYEAATRPLAVASGRA